MIQPGADMMLFFHRGAALFIGSLFAVGCSSPQEASWKTIDPTTMSTSQMQQKDRAMTAKDAMFNQLMGKLKEELGKGDPAGAIAVCQEEAPRIAQQVAKDKGVKIGRTALKLRNPQNQPPAWAKDLIDRSVAEPTFLENKQGEFAALLPIKLQAQCLLCHGSGEQIPAGVKNALTQRYPKDQATGFKEGDLRGWFWIEVLGPE
jgi:Protein of unknown function (DUF3365)